MSESKLISLVQRQKRSLWYHVQLEREAKKGWLSASQVLVPLQFSQKVYSPFSVKLYRKREGLAYCQQAPYTTLSLVKVEGYWAKVQLRGTTGDTGVRGIRGIKGVRGVKGVRGIKGVRGTGVTKDDTGAGDACERDPFLWVPVTSLRPVLKDLGKVYTHSPLPLYTSPHAVDAVSAIVPKGQFLKVLRLKGAWCELDYKGLRAWAPVLSVWSRFSFAQMVKVKFYESSENKKDSKNSKNPEISKGPQSQRGQWYSLMSLSARGVQLWEREKGFFTLPMSRVYSIKTSPYQLFLLPVQENFKLYSAPRLQASFQKVKRNFHRLRHLAFHQERWKGGKHPRQGFIWWKQNDSSPFVLKKKKLLAYSQLRERGIFASALFPRKGIGVISSGGIFIYKKEEGKFWHLHPFFNQDNYPVAIDERGNLYVGPYVSYDRGKTFVEYLNYKPLLKQLKSMGLSRLDALSISQIIPMPDKSNLKNLNEKSQELLLQLKVGKKIFYAFGQPQKGYFQWVHKP